ncbi:uncharacterized protein LOC129753786 [Uranotaenia lowii]|uniref:uncharacterized protein LOC129753786 n=1 Tax=Uranotaenia lowii TaxID=190385 RepID=UPI00247A605D|nr:uncharacterized protein LOC129753786 [Uranotaenia lowii]
MGLKESVNNFRRCVTVFDTVYPNHILLKIFGLTIYTVYGDPKDGRVKITFWDAVGFFRLMVMELFVLYASLMSVLNLKSTGSVILDNGTRYTIVLGSIYITLLAVSNYWSYEKAIKCNAPVNQVAQKRTFLQCIGCVVCIWIFLGFVNTKGANQVSESLETRLAIIFSSLCFAIPFTLIELQLFCFGYLISYRLNHLNETLSVNFVAPGKKSTLILKELPVPRSLQADKSKLLNELWLQWSNVNKAAQMTSKVVSGQLIFVSVANVVMNTFSLFTLYRALISQDSQQEWLAVFNVTTSVFLGIFGMVIIEIMDRIKRQGAKTAILVHKAFQNYDNTPIKEELLQFSQYMSHRKIVINCYLFECDWTLGMSIMSTMISYLVILIQFDDSFVTTVENK